MHEDDLVDDELDNDLDESDADQENQDDDLGDQDQDDDQHDDEEELIISIGGEAPTPPSLSLFGQALPGSEGAGQQGPGMRQQTIRAVVVESDITGTQNRLQNYQQRAEVG